MIARSHATAWQVPDVWEPIDAAVASTKAFMRRNPISRSQLIAVLKDSYIICSMMLEALIALPASVWQRPVFFATFQLKTH
jgi:hypothetical protein